MYSVGRNQNLLLKVLIHTWILVLNSWVWWFLNPTCEPKLKLHEWGLLSPLFHNTPIHTPSPFKHCFFALITLYYILIRTMHAWVCMAYAWTFFLYIFFFNFNKILKLYLIFKLTHHWLFSKRQHHCYSNYFLSFQDFLSIILIHFSI